MQGCSKGCDSPSKWAPGDIMGLPSNALSWKHFFKNKIFKKGSKCALSEEDAGKSRFWEQSCAAGRATRYSLALCVAALDVTRPRRGALSGQLSSVRPLSSLPSRVLSPKLLLSVEVEAAFPPGTQGSCLKSMASC